MGFNFFPTLVNGMWAPMHHAKWMVCEYEHILKNSYHLFDKQYFVIF
jgi:hypothetical protein